MCAAAPRAGASQPSERPIPPCVVRPGSACSAAGDRAAALRHLELDLAPLALAWVADVFVRPPLAGQVGAHAMIEEALRVAQAELACGLAADSGLHAWFHRVVLRTVVERYVFPLPGKDWAPPVREAVATYTVHVLFPQMQVSVRGSHAQFQDGCITTVLNDALLELLKKLDKFEPLRGGFPAYFATIVRRRALDHYSRDRVCHHKRKGPMPIIGSLDAAPGAAGLRGVVDARPIDPPLATECERIIAECLAGLSERECQLLRLFLWEQRSSREVAEVIGAESSGIGTMVVRAFEHLAEHLRPALAPLLRSRDMDAEEFIARMLPALRQRRRGDAGDAMSGDRAS